MASDLKIGMTELTSGDRDIPVSRLVDLLDVVLFSRSRMRWMRLVQTATTFGFMAGPSEKTVDHGRDSLQSKRDFEI